MLNSNSSVSVVIPAFNRSEYIGEAIKSALAQTPLPLEILVVDDGSEDDTAEVAAAFGDPVKLFRRVHGGIAAARNFGAAQARGTLLAFLDSDDLWTASKLDEQLKLLGSLPSCDGVFGLVKQFYTPGLEIPAGLRQKLDNTIETGYHAGTLLIRKESFERVGNFDEECRVGEFIDWYARAQDAGLRFGMVNKVVMSRRIHRTNTGITQVAARADYAKVLKAVLDRRKQIVHQRDPQHGHGNAER
jgi:glycosyltransferase involved in cell wall biosynthesis